MWAELAKQLVSACDKIQTFRIIIGGIPVSIKEMEDNSWVNFLEIQNTDPGVSRISIPEPFNYSKQLK